MSVNVKACEDTKNWQFQNNNIKEDFTFSQIIKEDWKPRGWITCVSGDTTVYSRINQNAQAAYSRVNNMAETLLQFHTRRKTVLFSLPCTVKLHYIYRTLHYIKRGQWVNHFHASSIPNCIALFIAMLFLSDE